MQVFMRNWIFKLMGLMMTFRNHNQSHLHYVLGGAVQDRADESHDEIHHLSTADLGSKFTRLIPRTLICMSQSCVSHKGLTRQSVLTIFS